MELRPLIAVLLCASICSGCVFIPESALESEGASPFRGTDLGFSKSPELRLTDHTGALFELDEQTDGITLISFMFTQCKDICLISEADLSLIRGTLTSEESENISIISVTLDPENDDVETLAEIALNTSRVAETFGERPRVAMLSFSDFGEHRTHQEVKRVRDAMTLVRQQRPERRPLARHL